MEVVCLILGPMLASQPCSHAFWVLTSLHLPFIFTENVFYYSCYYQYYYYYYYYYFPDKSFLFVELSQ